MNHNASLARIARCALSAAALGALAAPAVAQTWTLYDDFSSSTSISSNRWSGDDGRQSAGIRLEARRAIVGGQLRLESRSVGDNVRSEGISQTRNAVLFTNGQSINGIKALVTMRSGTIGTCTANTSFGQVRARLFGFYFNTGTPIEGSLTNEVIAGIQLARAYNSTDAAGIYRVNAFIGVCTDDACVNSKTIVNQELLTNVALNQAVELSILWDAAANAFRVTTNGTPATLSYNGLLSDARPSTNPIRRMEVSSNIQQCQGTRVSATIGADFDNVQTTALAVAANAAPAMHIEEPAGTEQPGLN